MGGFLQSGSVDSISVLSHFLGRGPFRNEAGEPGLGAGLLDGLVHSVKDVRAGEGAHRDVEAALYGADGNVSYMARNTCMDVRQWAQWQERGLTPKPSFTGWAW